VVLFSDSPRSVDPGTARRIFAAAGPYVARVCVSHTRSRSDLEEILALCPTAIQISHPHLVPAERNCRIVRVVEPGSEIPGPADTDAIIVDASQGKGKAYDPEYVRMVMGSTSLPVVVAGGLNPGNVRDAVRACRPYGVDVASGVESSPGIKDPAKVRAFINNARIIQ
jgi:phosphoribosylanthranilate isomerase